MLKFHQSGARAEEARPSEEGFILLAVLLLTVLLLISLAVAAPKIAKSIQRDKEIELVHRGEEYKHAIRLYYKKFGAYPTSIDQLVNTNNIRFLRKRYTDPITGKDDWRLIYYGQAKVPPMGLFGQPLALVGPTTGAPLGGPTGAPADQSNGAAPGQQNTVTVDQPQDQDNSNSNSSDSGQNNSENGASGESSTTNPSVTITAPTPTPPGTPPGTAPGTAPGAAYAAGGTTTGGAFGSTLGGGPIVGVGIPNTKASLIEYKKQKHYNQWEFVYNPLEDTLAGGLAGGATTTVNGTNGTTPGATTPGATTGPGVTPTYGGIGTSPGTSPG